MTIRLARAKCTGLAASLLAGTLVQAAASHSSAAHAGGIAKVKPVEVIVHAVQAKGDRGTLFRPPTTIEPPPGPRVRDNRGDVTKFVAATCGHHPRPCKGMPRK